MSEGTEQHLEHAEHAQHHAYNPFDRRVAMTMAIMAALLAGVTLVSHRGHTETLRLTTEATTNHTKASDDWNLYQAKNIRSHEYQAFLFLESMLAKDVVKHDDESAAMRRFWVDQVDKYEGKGYWASFLENLQGSKGKSDAKGSNPVVPAQSGELAMLKHNAEELQAHARTLEDQSHLLHAHVTWIDIGHLGLELALVMCAVAVLTKQRTFWLTGIGFALAGSAVAGYGMVGWWNS
jgi:Domain of unknown function (DUF4337)